MGYPLFFIQSTRHQSSVYYRDRHQTFLSFLSKMRAICNTSLLSAGLLFLLFVVGHVRAQFNEPPGERREQTFRVLEFEDGTVNQHYDGTMRYYCTFRGKWTKERHPIDFPRSASWGPPILLSHSNGYRMWSGTEAATLGVESIAEVSSFPSAW